MSLGNTDYKLRAPVKSQKHYSYYPNGLTIRHKTLWVIGTFWKMSGTKRSSSYWYDVHHHESIFVAFHAIFYLRDWVRERTLANQNVRRLEKIWSQFKHAHHRLSHVSILTSRVPCELYYTHGQYGWSSSWLLWRPTSKWKCVSWTILLT